MHTPAHGRAGGKVILLGEHVVVYGRPALATGVPLIVDATVEMGSGPQLVSEVASDPRTIRLVAEASRFVGLDPTSVVVRVRSEIPPGRGLGSSAALAVAVLRALSTAAGRRLDMATTLAQGRVLEQIFHGTPSGVDPAAAALGSCFRFVRGEPPVVTPVHAGARVRLVVAFGDRVRSTAAAVGGLQERWATDRERHERLFDEVAGIVEEGVAALERGDLAGIGAAFDRNQAVLETLGVSHPEVEALIASARQAGALGAKLTGGGAGGAIVAVGSDVESIANGLRHTGATVLVVDVSAG